VTPLFLSINPTQEISAMTIYTATFRTADTWATEEIDAETPEQALRQARALADNDIDALDWCTYDPASVPLDEIEIAGPDSAGAVWQSEDLALRLAASDVLGALEAQTDAAQGVFDAWAKGDLAGAVRMLAGSMPAARAAIAKARPPAE
jgi:hypothetical protein